MQKMLNMKRDKKMWPILSKIKQSIDTVCDCQQVWESAKTSNQLTNVKRAKSNNV